MPSKLLKEFLDENDIKYVSIMHSMAFTAVDIAKSAHIPTRELAKTVIIKIDNEMAMAVVPANYKVKLEILAQALGVPTPFFFQSVTLYTTTSQQAHAQLTAPISSILLDPARASAPIQGGLSRCLLDGWPARHNSRKAASTLEHTWREQTSLAAPGRPHGVRNRRQDITP